MYKDINILANLLSFLGPLLLLLLLYLRIFCLKLEISIVRCAQLLARF